MQPLNTNQLKSHPAGPGEPTPDATCYWPKHHEEQWAAQSSPITRLTGRLILALQALIIVSAFFTQSLNINILSIIAGFAILKGSQTWLRFHTFSSSFMACSVWWILAPAIILNHPIEFDIPSRAKWLTRDDLELWTLGVAFAGVSTMEATVCILSLHTRRLVFWTKKSRKWGGIAIALTAFALIAQGIDFANESAKLRKLETTYQVELQAIRSELAHGTPSGISVFYHDNAILRANPKIRLVVWETLKGRSVENIYSRDKLYRYNSSDPAIKIPHQLPSGEHGHILIYLDKKAHPKP